MTESKIKTAAVLPLRDVVVFPGMVVPLFVGRSKSIKALESAMKDSLPIILVAQKNAETDNPTIEDVYSTGTLSTILQMVKLQDGTHKVLIEGSKRVVLNNIHDDEFFKAEYIDPKQAHVSDLKEVQILMRSLKDNFSLYAKQNVAWIPYSAIE